MAFIKVSKDQKMQIYMKRREDNHKRILGKFATHKKKNKTFYVVTVQEDDSSDVPVAFIRKIKLTKHRQREKSTVTIYKKRLLKNSDLKEVFRISKNYFMFTLFCNLPSKYDLTSIINHTIRTIKDQN